MAEVGDGFVNLSIQGSLLLMVRWGNFSKSIHSDASNVNICGASFNWSHIALNRSSRGVVILPLRVSLRLS